MPFHGTTEEKTRYQKKRRLDALRGNVYSYPVRGVRRRVEALYAIGYSSRQIAEHSDHLTKNEIRSIFKPERERVWADTHHAVDEVYEKLAAHPISGGYADRQRRTAIKRGWAPPLAWDDIDNDPAPQGMPDQCSIWGCTLMRRKAGLTCYKHRHEDLRAQQAAA